MADSGIQSLKWDSTPLPTVGTLFKAIDIGVPGALPGSDIQHSFTLIPGELPVCSSQGQGKAFPELVQPPIWNPLLPEYQALAWVQSSSFT